MQQTIRLKSTLRRGCFFYYDQEVPMSTIQLITEHCTCCLTPVEYCTNSPPVSTYEVFTPPIEDVKDDADRVAVGDKIWYNIGEG
jgi:hypothetical protein